MTTIKKCFHSYTIWPDSLSCFLPVQGIKNVTTNPTGRLATANRSRVIICVTKLLARTGVTFEHPLHCTKFGCCFVGVRRT